MSLILNLFELGFWSVIYLLLLAVSAVGAVSWVAMFPRHFDEPWWKGIVPFYNMWIYCQKLFGDDKGWVFFLLFVPGLNALYTLYLSYALVKVLNREIWMVPLTFLVPIVGLPLLAFQSSSEYTGPIPHLVLDKDATIEFN